MPDTIVNAISLDMAVYVAAEWIGPTRGTQERLLM